MKALTEEMFCNNFSPTSVWFEISNFVRIQEASVSAVVDTVFKGNLVWRNEPDYCEALNENPLPNF